MAQEKKGAIDKAKIKTMKKLKTNGFDTAAKIRLLDARQMLKLGMQQKCRIYSICRMR